MIKNKTKKLKENKELYKNFLKKFDRDYCMDEMERMFLETIEKKKNEKQK